MSFAIEEVPPTTPRAAAAAQAGFLGENLLL